MPPQKLLKQSPRTKSLNSEIDPVEWDRLQELTRYEREARERGVKVIAGVDEAGRGPLAGPVVAATCVIPEGIWLPGIDDSKKLTMRKRREFFLWIKENGIDYSVGIVHAEVIDEINILQATIRAMQEAVRGLQEKADLLLVDGLYVECDGIPVEKIIKGDQKSQSIAAASVIAKETRDDLMREYDERWPQYGFSGHKGYGTKRHMEALREFGPCEIHRRSFAPVLKYSMN